ncbi:hypothetical protein KIPB_008040 [Kipferlia bialata]|uniref:Kelch-type beta propeller n=1 Tax=Kipferlia bialata TaxID=797122 RepID=A0A9K3D136_9EUKA|nr:hypothetical protein KIPB_008040 [Kipferlia bialata]|eukprot:g8040.t1
MSTSTRRAEWGHIHLDTLVVAPSAVVKISENQVATVGALPPSQAAVPSLQERLRIMDGLAPREAETIVCMIVTKRSDGSYTQEVIPLPFSDRAVYNGVVYYAGKLYMLLCDPKTDEHYEPDSIYLPFSSRGSVAVLSLDTQQCTVLPASDLPCSTITRCSFILGDTWYIAGWNTDTKRTPVLLTYHPLSNRWDRVESGVFGNLTPMISSTVVDNTAYILCDYKGTIEYTGRIVASFTERSGFRTVARLPKTSAELRMFSIGRNLFIYDTKKMYEPVVLLSYSTVSGKWAEYRSGVKPSVGFVGEHIGDGDLILFMGETPFDREPECLSLTVSQPFFAGE